MKIGARTITTITDDGSIVIKDYKPGSRKAHSTKNPLALLSNFKYYATNLKPALKQRTSGFE